jgi:hypothetical protein
MNIAIRFLLRCRRCNASEWSVWRYRKNLFFKSLFILASVAALPPPGFETLSMVGLVAISGRSPRLLLCILIWCCCISAAVYLPLCICRCVYCVVYPLLYLLLFIYHCVSAAVYLPPCICRCVYRAVFLNYFCISAAVNMYPDLVLYIYLPWCICHQCS